MANRKYIVDPFNYGSGEAIMNKGATPLVIFALLSIINYFPLLNIFWKIFLNLSLWILVILFDIAEIEKIKYESSQYLIGYLIALLILLIIIYPVYFSLGIIGIFDCILVISQAAIIFKTLLERVINFIKGNL